MGVLFENYPMHLTYKINYFQTSNPTNPFKRSNNYDNKPRKLSIEHLDNNKVPYLYDLTYFV